MEALHKCILALQVAVDAVCPNTGVFIGRRPLRDTWGVRPTPEATTQQRRAAQNVINAFVDNFVDDPPVDEIAALKARVAALEARSV